MRCAKTILVLLFLVATNAAAEEFCVDVWYGDQQRFGNVGHAQKWINILGNVRPASQVASLTYSLNGAAELPLSFREDRKRIARDGDFNIEIDRRLLVRGENAIRIKVAGGDGTTTEQIVKVDYQEKGDAWPLPYVIDWTNVDHLQDVAQVVDGKWKLTADGVRSVERYYDRIIAFGDRSWRDYEITTTITVHALTGPKQGANTTGVTHAAIAVRWPGHDADGQQPSVKWHPLGATAEFRLGSDLQQCRWRIFDGKQGGYVESQRRRVLEFEKPYRMKHRVETLADGRTRNRVKLWPADQDEPEAWDLERFEVDDLVAGSVCLIAHHSDVTFGNVSAVPLDNRDKDSNPE